ncbi:ATP-binding cassette domain-containing protein [Pseudomonas sp. LRF_L74]|uniref:ATP-binding cassette domain-containing protein n=1 Tax=Pseudomonas sp. LRF_L74 TaxID=3369422 RepID=UPI003F62697C
MSELLLQASGLRIESAAGQVLVDGVDLALAAGRTLALVGESGSGKSLTALSLIRLLPPGLRLTCGELRFGGHDLSRLSLREIRRLRGSGIAMVFQDPLSALNPIMSIGRQMREAVACHETLEGAALQARIEELLELVQLPQARALLREYPQRLSGGMRQRVLIAMALAGRPRVLIADEPTTALDALVRHSIMQVLADLQRRLGLAVLLISHDLALVARYADDIAVMRGGRILEAGAARQVLERPTHPYTRGLLLARPGQVRRSPGDPPPRLPELPAVKTFPDMEGQP